MIDLFGSSSKKTTTNTTNNYDQRENYNTENTDNSFEGSIDNSVNTLDGGAISDAFSFGKESLLTLENSVSDSLGFGSDALYTTEKSSDNLLSGIKAALGFGDDTARSAFDFSANATDKAMDVSVAALSYYDKINRDSMQTAEKATHNALDFAANATKADGLTTVESMTKYLMIGVAVLGAALVFKK